VFISFGARDIWDEKFGGLCPSRAKEVCGQRNTIKNGPIAGIAQSV
jgi:hypothetical protein